MSGYATNRRADLAREARNHYEDVSIRMGHWSNSIRDAIDCWENEPAQLEKLAAVEAERDQLRAALEEIAGATTDKDSVLGLAAYARLALKGKT
jgi:hypothetical protein